MAAPALVPIPGVCRICGCTDSKACLGDGGEYCAWADDTRTLCTFCAALHSDMHAALDEGLRDDEEPLVIPVTEGQCNQYIRALRERGDIPP